MFATIISTLVPVFGILFLGLAMARRGVLPMEAAAGLNQFVYWAALPALMFNILSRLDPGIVSSRFVLALYAAQIVCYLLCFALISRFFKQLRAEAAMLSCMAGFPNVAFMGVAIISFLLPDESSALPLAGLCAFLYIVVMPFTDTLLNLRQHKGEPFFRLMRSVIVSLMRNPMVVAGVLGLTLSLTRTAVPSWALNTVSMLGSTAAPCSLFAMGMVMNAQLASMAALSHTKPGRQFGVHAVKLVLLPAVTYCFLWLAGIRGIELGAATLFAGMPVAIAAYVVAERYQVCVRETSMIIFLNTLASIGTIPLTIYALYALEALPL